MFKQKMYQNYAQLAVQVGVNIQPNQLLFISASIEVKDFVRLIVEEAYNCGARQVFADWSDDVITRLRYEKAPADSFNEFPSWKQIERETLVEQGAAFISIVSQGPDLLNGIDPQRISANQKATGLALQKFRQAMQADQFSWTVIAAPSVEWAKKVFPEKTDTAAVEALWDAILKAVRADVDDPIEAWKQHDITLHEKVHYLNDKKYASLHFVSPNTDLTIELPTHHLWCGASSINKNGHAFMANMPTEEVFTTPLKTGVNGTVTSTKPLSYSGTIIDNFTLTFKDGAITNVVAEQGQQVLEQLIQTDDGAKYLGEVALVPHQSPISQSGFLFFNTLFDENASNHLAIGSSYAFCLEGGKELSSDELLEAGLNQSITHVDFMIGSEVMDVFGITQDGKREAIFQKGNWAF